MHSAVADAGGIVIASTRPGRAGHPVRGAPRAGTAPIASLAETPVVNPVVTYARVTDRELACAVLWPSGHVPGSRRLPVVMAPYGGPHHARVVHAAGAFAPDQWLADQGFAVVVVDGAGTPGRGPAFEFEVSQDLAQRVLDDQVAALQALGEQSRRPRPRPGGHHRVVVRRLPRRTRRPRPAGRLPCRRGRGARHRLGALRHGVHASATSGLPQENPDAYAATSLLRRAARLERPLLIIHGLADDNVLVANSLQLSSALLAAGRPHSVLPLSGVTHMTPQEVVAENLLRLEVGFLAEHLQ